MLLLAAALGVALAALSIPIPRLDSRSIAFVALVAGGAGVILLDRHASHIFALLIFASLVGTRHRLLGGVIDTRYVGIGLAGLYLIRLICTSRNGIRRGSHARAASVRPFWTGWLLFTSGTLIATLVDHSSAHQTVYCINVTVVLLAVLLAAERTGPTAALGIWTVVAAMVALGALGQYFHLPLAPPPYVTTIFDTSRYDSFFGDPNTLGTFLAICLVMTISSLIRPGVTTRWRATGFVAAFAQVAGLMLTASRGAAGAAMLGLGLPLFVGVFGGSIVGRRQRWLAVATAGALAVVGMVFFAGFGSGFAKRLSDSQSFGDQARYQAMDQGLRLALNHPLLGVGPDAFQRAVVSQLHFPILLQHAHNVFLNVWAERGLLSIVGLLIMILAPCWALYRARSVTRSVGLSLADLLLGIGVPVALCFHGAVENLFLELQGQLAVSLELALACLILMQTTRRQGVGSAPNDAMEYAL